MEWHEMVSVGIVATALGAPVGDVLKWLLWELITMVGERLDLGYGQVGAPLNATPDVRTSESSADPDARADVDDFTDSESGGIAIVAIRGEPSSEDHGGNN